MVSFEENTAFGLPLSISLSYQRHQRFYSLLDRFRATVSDTNSPPTPVTSHPLDGDPPPAPELVIADKVKD